MLLKTELEAELKASLLKGDRLRAEVLRGLKAAILNEEVAKGQREAGLDDAAVEQVIAREVKKRQESQAIYLANNREDLAETESHELAVLKTYLPDQLDEVEVREAVQAAIDELGASGVKAMGQVIGNIKAKHGAAVDGALGARLTKELLQD